MTTYLFLDFSLFFIFSVHNTSQKSTTNSVSPIISDFVMMFTEYCPASNINELSHNMGIFDACETYDDFRNHTMIMGTGVYIHDNQHVSIRNTTEAMFASNDYCYDYIGNMNRKRQRSEWDIEDGRWQRESVRWQEHLTQCELEKGYPLPPAMQALVSYKWEDLLHKHAVKHVAFLTDNSYPNKKRMVRVLRDKETGINVCDVLIRGYILGLYVNYVFDEELNECCLWRR